MNISSTKFYPNNQKWGEPYIHYLGSISINSVNYDLGIWMSENKADISLCLVQSEEVGDYQSGSIMKNNVIEQHTFRHIYASKLPVKETVLLAQEQGYFNHTPFKDFNFNQQYLLEFDITRFLLQPSKTEDIIVYLKNTMEKLNVSIKVDENQKWNNKFIYQGEEIYYNRIYLIEGCL